MDTIQESVIVYKDFEMTKPWSQYEYLITFKGRKASLKDNSGIGVQKKSRFNELNWIGGITQGKEQIKNFYGLTVNGSQVFFKANYSIPK